MTASGGVFDYSGVKKRLDEIEAELSRPGAWDNPDRMTPVLQEKSVLSDKLELWEALKSSHEEVREWLELASMDQSEEALDALNEQLEQLDTRLADTELKTLLGGPQDKGGAILEIHPGAGGVESQDWAEMLLRMYTRWTEKNGFKLTVLDLAYADEAGIKSATLQIEGLYAYGFLKAERGIHRLIRISPFDSSGRRHTSFASVDVLPDVDQDIEIEVKEEDIRVDYFRSSGPGGQSVNTTSSAVRITHLETGIVAQCQNEKSQHKNKAFALKVLKARLYERHLQKLADERQQDYASKEAIGFGSQIRTYTLQPYRLVKDHRTNQESGNVDAVLDGDLELFIRSYLLHFHGEEQKQQ